MAIISRRTADKWIKSGKGIIRGKMCPQGWDNRYGYKQYDIIDNVVKKTTNHVISRIQD